MRRPGLLLWPAGIAVGLWAEWVGFGWSDPRHWIPDLVTGWTLISCGLIASARRPESHSGALMTATGFSWFLWNFAGVSAGVVAWVASHGIYLYRGPLIHLVLAYPSGRPSSRLVGTAIAVGYAAAIVNPVWRSEVATIILAGLLVVVSVREYSPSVGRSRRARLWALWGAIGLSSALAGGAVARLAISEGSAVYPSTLGFEAMLCIIAAGLLAGLLSTSWERAAVTDLVVELGEARPRTLRGVLSRALGDPTLEVGYWLSEAGAFVDSEGRVVRLPDPGSDRSVTMIERDGQPVAALVHDPTVLDDPGLVEAVASGAQLAASNARLHAEVRARVVELGASRRRILEAGDEERRRLEQRLSDGAEHRLEDLSEALERGRLSAPGEETRERIDRAERQLARTLEDLRELSLGLHPRVLSERGLEGALASLAERSPIPVEVTVTGDPIPPGVEAAAYFVCSEALANVAKYASATRVAVSVSSRNATVRVEVQDDGVGGADPARGSGLRGLADRVETLGGTLRVESSAGNGTRLAAEIPLSGEAL